MSGWGSLEVKQFAVTHPTFWGHVHVMRYLVGTGSNPHLPPIASAGRLQAVGTDGCLAGCKRLGTRHLFPFPVHAGSLATHHGWPGDQTTARIVQKL